MHENRAKRLKHRSPHLADTVHNAIEEAGKFEEQSEIQKELDRQIKSVQKDRDRLTRETAAQKKEMLRRLEEMKGICARVQKDGRAWCERLKQESMQVLGKVSDKDGRNVANHARAHWDSVEAGGREVWSGYGRNY